MEEQTFPDSPTWAAVRPGSHTCLPVDCEVKIIKCWFACVNGLSPMNVTGIVSMGRKGFQERRSQCSVTLLQRLRKKRYQVTGMVV